MTQNGSFRLVELFSHGVVLPDNVGSLNREGAVSNSSAAVAQYLPFLRRYARALTGSQASGDAYVAATLEALIADRTVIEDPRGPRVALYRLFTTIWNSVAVNGAPSAGEDELPGEHKLANITPLPRQAFLLVALEGFSEPDAARVLDIDVTKLRGLVEESCRELAAEIATDVLIIEDDTFSAMELETLVEGLGHRVLGVARTHAEALALTKNKRPGLILADIQLADGSSGFETALRLPIEYPSPRTPAEKLYWPPRGSEKLRFHSEPSACM